MPTYLSTTNPPTGSPIGVDPLQSKPWEDSYHLNGSEVTTIAGRSLDVTNEIVDIGPLHFSALTASQRTSVKTTLETKGTLYLQLPDDNATVFTGYVQDWKFSPISYGGAVIRWDLEFTFKATVAP